MHLKLKQKMGNGNQFFNSVWFRMYVVLLWKLKNTFQPVVDLSHHSLLKCGFGLVFFGIVLRIDVPRLMILAANGNLIPMIRHSFLYLSVLKA